MRRSNTFTSISIITKSVCMSFVCMSPGSTLSQEPPHQAAAADPAPPVRQRLPLEGERRRRFGGGSPQSGGDLGHELPRERQLVGLRQLAVTVSVDQQQR